MFFRLFLIAVITFPAGVYAKHNTGRDCLSCHPGLRIAGSVFTTSEGTVPYADSPVVLTDHEGNETVLDKSDSAGNFMSPTVPEGRYLPQVGARTGRTWHSIPEQGSCNVCHTVNVNGSGQGKKLLPEYHTTLPSDNACTHCHHFPASMSPEILQASGVLNTASESPSLPVSRVELAGLMYTFDPSEYEIETVRFDIFAPGWFSMFDVILAVAKKNDIPVGFYYDESRKTHFITEINGVTDDYWYHFSYHVRSENTREITYRRAYRWDEALWRPGVWIRVVTGENLDEIKDEYLEEITRENEQGHVVPQVSIVINPTDYDGNPEGSGRISVRRDYENVRVTAHNYRSTGFPSPYSKPFQPGVTTSLDILLSLMDQGELDLATGMFYTYFNKNYIDSYYVVALGFPGVGVAHASGRQGFVYITNNGDYSNMPNNADRKFHMTSDISVVHAPDFSTWRWIELGDPYYERKEPSEANKDEVREDHEAISRGFNLYNPSPNPFNSTVIIPINIFNPGHLTLSVYGVNGQKIATLFDDDIDHTGILRLSWSPKEVSSGVYFLVAKSAKRMQLKRVSYLK